MECKFRRAATLRFASVSRARWDFDELGTARAATISSSVLDNEHEIAARLSLSSNSHLFMLERVRQAGDEPFALETCYLSADEFPALAGGELERGSLFITLEHEHGVELAYAVVEIDATAADLKTAELLAVPRGSPLLRIRQSIFTTTGRDCMYVLGLYRSGRHTLVIRRVR